MQFVESFFGNKGYNQGFVVIFVLESFRGVGVGGQVCCGRIQSGRVEDADCAGDEMEVRRCRLLLYGNPAPIRKLYNIIILPNFNK